MFSKNYMYAKEGWKRTKENYKCRKNDIDEYKKTFKEIYFEGNHSYFRRKYPNFFTTLIGGLILVCFSLYAMIQNDFKINDTRDIIIFLGFIGGISSWLGFLNLIFNGRLFERLYLFKKNGRITIVFNHIRMNQSEIQTIIHYPKIKIIVFNKKNKKQEGLFYYSNNEMNIFLKILSENIQVKTNDEEKKEIYHTYRH